MRLRGEKTASVRVNETNFTPKRTMAQMTDETLQGEKEQKRTSESFEATRNNPNCNLALLVSLVIDICYSLLPCMWHISGWPSKSLLPSPLLSCK